LLEIFLDARKKAAKRIGSNIAAIIEALFLIKVFTVLSYCRL